jgi:hypothetical protein
VFWDRVMLAVLAGYRTGPVRIGIAEESKEE